MKTLIAYFSLDGNSKRIAEELHRKLPNTTLHAIELASKPIKGKLWRTMIYGFKATFYKNMAIKPSTLEYVPFFGWDTHENGHTRLSVMKTQIDQPIAQLIKDLEELGL